MSFNVAGLNAGLKKGFVATVHKHQPDILCIQETKLNSSPPEKSPFTLKEYPHQYWSHCTAKKGYSGSAVFSKIKPLSVNYELDDFKDEGRTITLEFDSFWLVASYVPNAGSKLERMDVKLKFNAAIKDHMEHLAESKPVIWAGDLNVAHKEIDLARPANNHKTAGFTPQERKSFTGILENPKHQMVDAFRAFHPNEKDKYSYYSYRFNCKAKNIGWRLDYFVVSESLMDKVEESDIWVEDYGASDHCPLTLVLNTAK
jgi:exodeoxyribonuclease III